jgi:tetratricopeptide (TPR) repeat protein
MNEQGSYARSREWKANARFSEGLKTLSDTRTIPSVEKTREALSLFREATALDPSFGRAHFYVGIASELHGEHRQAIGAFESLLQDKRAPRLELLYNLALSWFHLYDSQAYEKALSYIDSLIRETERDGRQGPTAGVDERRRMTSAVLLAKTLRAQVLSHRAIREDETNAENSRRNAKADANGVLAALETYINDVEPEVAEDVRWGAWNALGHIDHMAGRRHKNLQLLTAAEDAFNRALQFSPHNYRVLSNLAANHYFISEIQGNPESRRRQSRAVFAEVLRIRPDYDYAHYRLAEIALAEDQFDEALEQLQLAKDHPSEMTPETLERLQTEIDTRRPQRTIRLDHEN